MASASGCSGSHPVPPVPRALAAPEVRERAARMLRAAGDPARLALLELLEAGPLCVSDLTALSGDPMPTVSQRLRLLRTDGLVTARRDGKHVFYALADGHVRELIGNILVHAAEASGGDSFPEAPPVPVGPSTPRVPPSVDLPRTPR